MKKKILIVHPGPLGDHTPTLNYCFWLRNFYEVFYIGIDEGNGFKVVENIFTTHLKFRKNKFVRKLSFISFVLRFIKNDKFDFVLVNYFPACSILNFASRNVLAVEIRTSYIFKSKFRRNIYNYILSKEASLFVNITTLSKGLIEYLNLPKRTKVIPLGGPDVTNLVSKNFEQFNFLYVGTFRQRDIHKTIYGFAKFIKYAESKNIDAYYHIVGFGSEEDVRLLKKIAFDLNIENRIIFYGLVRYPELASIFEKCNIGVSFIPINEYFQYQPPTKTYEYLINGMPVIATNTFENQTVINSSNGVLIEDSVDGFYQGCKYMADNINNFNSIKISLDTKFYTWESIVSKVLCPYIESINLNY